MLKKVAIIGGGLAGISAAINLHNIAEIHLFEARKSIGGRVHSFQDNNFNYSLDNGMHLMIGAYEETLKLLKMINSEQLIRRMKLNIPFYAPQNPAPLFNLRSTSILPGPLHLIPSMITSGIFSSGEIFNILPLLWKEKMKTKQSCLEFLIHLKQRQDTIVKFWQPLILATLNSSVENANADNLLAVLKKGFFAGSKRANLILPKAPFDEIFGFPAFKWLEKNNIHVHLNTMINELQKANIGYYLNSRKGKSILFDSIIIATPYGQIKKLLPEFNPELESSPISSFYFTIEGDTKLLPQHEIMALLYSPLHWLFYSLQQNFYSITASASELFWNQEEIQTELKKIFPGNWKIRHFKRIIVKKATPLFTPHNSALRAFQLPDKGIFFAGDWTNTGLPASIEGAVISGKQASREVKSFIV